jgi:outer membrane biosynthesis protein TonB
MSFFSSAAKERCSPAPIPSMSDMQLTFEVLSATHGADFEDYLNKLEASVKRNWYTVMPESALMGKKGIVSLTLHIQRDGTLPADDPTFQSVSGTEAFDKAVVDSIRNSAPFEHLPSSVQSRNIKLRVVFYYNLPVDLPKGTSHPSKSQTVTQLSE